MAKTNKTQYAILGMLSIAPMSGYDMKKYIEKSIAFFWNENYGHIYPILKRLESEGMVSKKTEVSESRPNRHIYTISDIGREKLYQWMITSSEQTPIRDERLFKLFFGNLVTVDENMRRVAEELSEEITSLKILKSIEDMLQEVVEKEESYERKRMYQFQWLTVRKGIYLKKASISWAEDALQQLKKMQLDF